MTDAVPNPLIARAELARQVVENPIFDQAVRDMHEELVNRWIEAPDGAQEIKDLAHRNIRLLYVFLGKLKGYIEMGKVAALEGEELP